MNKQFLLRVCFFLPTFLLAGGVAAARTLAGGIAEQPSACSAKPGRYEVKLDLKEFSILNAAARLGVGKYGGTADFAATVAKDGNDVVWTVRIDNPRLIEVWEYWMTEKTAELVNLLDFENLDPSGKSALATAKSINAKIARARANPIWDPVKISGLVAEKDNRWFIQTDHGECLVTGRKLEEIKRMIDKRVVVSGLVKVQDQIEVTQFLEKKQNTLELFVMSLCPFSKRAEASIIEFLEGSIGSNKPSLEVHYIFYRRNENGNSVFSSLHGEEEVQENLVQMVIRDAFADFYFAYLLARSRSSDSWEQIADAVGIGKEGVKTIRDAVSEGRDSLIKTEYTHVAEKHGIYDGSPTYVWESEPVKDIREIAVFKDFEFVSERCLED